MKRLIIVAALMAACGSDEPLQQVYDSCELDEDCETDLCHPVTSVCSVECIDHIDCPQANGLCTLTADGLRACVERCYGDHGFCPDGYRCMLTGVYPFWYTCWPDGTDLGGDL